MAFDSQDFIERWIWVDSSAEGVPDINQSILKQRSLGTIFEIKELNHLNLPLLSETILPFFDLAVDFCKVTVHLWLERSLKHVSKHFILNILSPVLHYLDFRVFSIFKAQFKSIFRILINCDAYSVLFLIKSNRVFFFSLFKLKLELICM